MFKLIMVLAAGASIAAATNIIEKAPALSADTGNWTVGNCILAQFAMEITLHPNKTDANSTLTVKVPADAQVDKAQTNCGKDIQLMKLVWTETAKNDSTVELHRNLTIEFGKINNTGYGVRHAYGNFELARFNYSYVNKENATVSLNVSSSVTINTKDVPSLMFRVPFHYSYLCGDVGHWEVYEQLFYSFDGRPGVDLKNGTVEAKNVRFDAFRDESAPHEGYQIPMDCAYQPNDIVPVAVGVTLAALVVIVLIAYLLGRRRARQRGYQSV
jgi:hypothetical protein